MRGALKWMTAALALAGIAGCASVQPRSGSLDGLRAEVDAQRAAPLAPPQAPDNRLSNVPWTQPQSRATPFAGIPKKPEPFYSNAQLRRNFLAIAMQAEATDYDNPSGNIPIAKWIAPIRYSVDGGTARDIRRLNALTGRIRGLTGIDMARAGGTAPNLRIHFVPFRLRNNAFYNLMERGYLGRATAGMMAMWRDTERAKCIGIISFDPRSGAITQANVYIKEELPPSVRNACITEEVVQSLGLMNDSPMARPSIFNDSQEYLELTSHDELLLRILYDPRIRPGMSVGQVYPLVDGIIRELRPGVDPWRTAALPR